MKPQTKLNWQLAGVIFDLIILLVLLGFTVALIFKGGDHFKSEQFVEAYCAWGLAALIGIYVRTCYLSDLLKK